MKDLVLAIFNIFRGVGKIFIFIRSLILNLLFFIIVAVILFSIFYSKEITVDNNSILTLTISGDIVEQINDSDPLNNSFNELFGLPSQAKETLLQDIIDALLQAEDDPNINGVLLDLAPMGKAGMNQLTEIGKALIQFRDSGKPVIAAEDYYNQSQYYLASYADKIFLNPLGGVHLNGFGLYRLYFQEALEKLKINYHVFKVGSYKSALEPFTRNSMSAEDRSQSQVWLSELWKNYTRDVSTQRSIGPEQIEQYINNVPDNLRAVGGDIARLALESNLVDELKTRPEINQYLVSLSASGPNGGFKKISFNNYLKLVHKSYNFQGTDQNSVAIIVAQGTIMPGKSRSGIVGSDTIAELLRQATTSEHIKAVVLRIDSGGGSAFASEIIRQEVLELKKSGKPLIVSMGKLAASGAYWLAADADEIWASPNTITGSIGIFMALPTFERVLNNAGIYRDGIGTTSVSTTLDLTKPLSIEIKEALQLALNHGYKTFLSIVSEGRNIPQSKVELIAQGKVYSGAAALELGLVDQLGSLPRAIRSAADHAGLDSYRIITLTPPLSFKEKIFRQVGAVSLVQYLAESYFPSSVSRKLFSAGKELQSLLLFEDPNGMYAHCLINYY